jgi:hypothetical protein
MARGWIAALLGVATLTTWVSDAGAHTIGCPPGQAVRGINFLTHRLVCVSVGAEAIAALEAAVAALQGQVAALQAENAGQAAAIATLQGEVDHLQARTTLSSPSGDYSITVTDTGIALAGPDVSIQLRNPGPAAVIELLTTDLLATVARNSEIVSNGATSITSGTETSVISGTNTNVVSGGQLNVSTGTHTNLQSGGQTNLESGSQTTVVSGGNMNLQGPLILLNGGCARVARVGDSVVSGGGGTLVIESNDSTVRSC